MIGLAAMRRSTDETRPRRPARKRTLAAARPLTAEERRELLLDFDPENPVWRDWLALTPAERLRRAWARRALIPDLEAAHDARTFAELLDPEP
jgi:hypothetical protein